MNTFQDSFFLLNFINRGILKYNCVVSSIHILVIHILEDEMGDILCVGFPSIFLTISQFTFTCISSTFLKFYFWIKFDHFSTFKQSFKNSKWNENWLKVLCYKSSDSVLIQGRHRRQGSLVLAWILRNRKRWWQRTLPIAEILSGKNVPAFLVCGFLMKAFKKKYPENMKKIVGAVWKLPAK